MIGNLGCNDPIKQAVKGIHASVCNAVSFTLTVLIQVPSHNHHFLAVGVIEKRNKLITGA